MKKKPFYSVVFILVTVITVLMLANASVWYARKDFSRDKVFSLTNFTQSMLSELPEKVQITYYVSEKIKNLYPQVRDVTELLYAYASSSKNVTVAVADPQARGMEKQLELLGIFPQQIQSTETNETTFVTVFSAITIEYNGKTEVIPFTLTTAGLEYDIDSRIQYLASGKERRAYLVVGNGLTLTEDYKYPIPWLESAGFICTQIVPSQLDDADKTVPLIVLGSSALNDEEAYHIELFLMLGGRAAFCVNRNSVNIYTDWKVAPDTSTAVIDLLDYWGIRVSPQLATDISNYRIIMQSTDNLAENTKNEYINYPFWIVTQSSGANAQHLITAQFGGLELYWPSPLELFSDESNTITPVIQTTSAAALVSSPFDTDPFHAQAKTDIKGSFTLAAAFEGRVRGFYTTGTGEPTRFFVIGDQYTPSAMVEYTNSPHNIDFFVNIMLWLSDEDDLLEIRGKGMRTTTFEKITDTDMFQQEKQKTMIVCFVFPLLLLIFTACAIYFSRRRQNHV